jgi:hypothetical protein
MRNRLRLISALLLLAVPERQAAVCCNQNAATGIGVHQQ